MVVKMGKKMNNKKANRTQKAKEENKKKKGKYQGKEVKANETKKKSRIVREVATGGAFSLKKQGILDKKIPKEVMKKQKELAKEAYKEAKEEKGQGNVTKRDVAKKFSEKEAKWVKEKS